MNVRLLHPPRHNSRFAEPQILTYAEYPIAQAFGSNDPTTQQQLMQQASRGSAHGPDHALFIADYNGLSVLARSEAQLNRAAEVLRRRFGSMLHVGAPTIRYADRVPVLEPYMVVLVNAPTTYLTAVRKDFIERHGRITRLVERETFLLEGEAPLAELLGYQRHVRKLLEEHWNEGSVAIWLSRYVPVDCDDPEAA